MPNARVGAMPQPNRDSNDVHPGRGGTTWRNTRVQSGMSMEDLKRQTALRLAHEQGESQSDGDEVTTPDHPMRNHPQQQSQPPNCNTRETGETAATASPTGQVSQMSPNNSSSGFHPPQQFAQQLPQHFASRDYPPPPPPSSNSGSNNPHYDAHNNYSGGNNNVGGYGDMPLFPSQSPARPQQQAQQPHQQRPQQQPPPPLTSTSTSNRPPPQSQLVSSSSTNSSSQQQHQPHQPQFSSPPQQMRVPRHATVLQDRGSFENVHHVGGSSDPYHAGSDNNMGYNGWGGGGGSSTNGSVGGRGMNNNGGNNGKSLSPQSSGQKGKSKGGSKGKMVQQHQHQQQHQQQQQQQLHNMQMQNQQHQQQRDVKTLDGRRTPVKDHNNEGQKILFATPNQRREIVSSTPSSVYSEPPRNKIIANRSNPNSTNSIAMSPAYNNNNSNNNNHNNHNHTNNNINNTNSMHLRVRTPDHGNNHPKGHSNNNNNSNNGTTYYPQNAHNKNMPGGGPSGPGAAGGKQSKLPHGLTVQELKEMTRARLAAEANELGGPDDGKPTAENKEYYTNEHLLQQAEISSNHSVGTQSSSKGSVRSGVGEQVHQQQQLQQQHHHHQYQGQGQQYQQHQVQQQQQQQQQQSQYYAQFRKNSSESAMSARSGVSNNVVPPNDYPNQVLNAQPYGQGQRMVQHGSQPQLHHPHYQQQQQQQQYQYPRQQSPAFGSGGQPRPYSPAFGPGQPRQHSPSFGAGPNQYNSNQHQQPPSQHQKDWKPQASDAWETASVASTLASEYQGSEAAFPAGGNTGNMPFSPQISDAGMAFNRGRCFSAGAGIPSSFDRYLFEVEQQQQQQQQQAAYYDPPMSGVANRRRCATMSPPGMSRLHEDRPFLFYGEDKERLSIPPLSEPRVRHAHQSGFNNQGVTFQALSSSASPQPPSLGSGSAFEPIGKAGSSSSLHRPKSPPNLTVERSTKFGPGDRALSTGSNVSMHGDLPSSVAESVLESITSGAPIPIGGDVIGESPFRSTKHPTDVSSAFRFDKESGGGSLFSSGSRSIFSPENSGENILGTNSWGGAESSLFDSNEGGAHSTYGLSHDFSSLLNIYGGDGPGLRGRAATAPCFGENEQLSPLFVSRIDPEHNGMGGQQYSPGLLDDLPGFSQTSSLNDGLGFDGHLRHSISAPISRLPDSSSIAEDTQTFD